MGAPRIYEIDSSSLERPRSASAARAHAIAPRRRLPALPASWRLPLIGSLVLLALACAVGSSLGRASSAEAPGVQRVDFAVSGRIALHGERLAGRDVKLVFHFPEVPLDAEKRLEDLHPDAAGRFTARFQWASRHSPQWFSLVVRKPGWQEQKLSRLFLTGDPPRCSIPPITLRQAAP